jgi:hypothetical protein
VIFEKTSVEKRKWMTEKATTIAKNLSGFSLPKIKALRKSVSTIVEEQAEGMPNEDQMIIDAARLEKGDMSEPIPKSLIKARASSESLKKASEKKKGKFNFVRYQATGLTRDSKVNLNREEMELENYHMLARGADASKGDLQNGHRDNKRRLMMERLANPMNRNELQGLVRVASEINPEYGKILFNSARGKAPDGRDDD